MFHILAYNTQTEWRLCKEYRLSSTRELGCPENDHESKLDWGGGWLGGGDGGGKGGMWMVFGGKRGARGGGGGENRVSLT